MKGKRFTNFYPYLTSFIGHMLIINSPLKNCFTDMNSSEALRHFTHLGNYDLSLTVPCII